MTCQLVRNLSKTQVSDKHATVVRNPLSLKGEREGVSDNTSVDPYPLSETVTDNFFMNATKKKWEICN